ncbi:MAG: translation elongation factor Ts [Candidatus Daviesbacteria bacterium]|nr:translation elongation factor Ts [Candidatus Daviesbacteria bacterium]
MNLELIKKLREETGAGIADCKEALKESNGNMEKAKVYLKEKGFDKAKSKAGREVKAGLVETYSHGGKVGVLVEVLCETDFVARTDDFKNLAHELALQIASMSPKNVDELLKQVYIRDEKMTVDDLVKQIIGKLGENIEVGRFERIVLGE